MRVELLVKPEAVCDCGVFTYFPCLSKILKYKAEQGREPKERNNMTREELFSLVREAGYRILDKIAEASARGDEEEVERLSESLKRMLNALMGKFEEEEEEKWGKGEEDWDTPVRKAIWAIRLAKSPRLLEWLRDIFGPYKSPAEKERERKREYYKKVGPRMNYYWNHIEYLVPKLDATYGKLRDLLRDAQTKDGDPFPEEEKEMVAKRGVVAHSLLLNLESTPELNPKVFVHKNREKFDLLADYDALFQLKTRILSLLGSRNPLYDPVLDSFMELLDLTWDLKQILKQLAEEDMFDATSITLEDVSETTRS
jgi:hypothetical protein